MIGFPNGRTPRVMTVSAEEMEAVQLQPGEKNYCADLHIQVSVYRSSIVLIMRIIVRPRCVITTMCLLVAGGATTSGTRWSTA